MSALPINSPYAAVSALLVLALALALLIRPLLA